MWKKAIYIMVALVLIGFAQATLCKDVVKPSVSCMLVTPAITCDTYSYEIFNGSGTTIESSSLGEFNASESLYYLNFTQTAGQYLVKLCDNSTREMYVQSNEVDLNMYEISIAILYIGFMFFLLYLGNQIKTTGTDSSGKEYLIPVNAFLKSMVLALAGYSSFFAVQLAVGFAEANSAAGPIRAPVEGLYHLNVWVYIIFLILFLFGTIFNYLLTLFRELAALFKTRGSR